MSSLLLSSRMLTKHLAMEDAHTMQIVLAMLRTTSPVDKLRIDLKFVHILQGVGRQDFI